MMANLELSLACVPNYDRTGPLLKGWVQPEGIRFVPHEFTFPGDIFRRIAQSAEYDVSEMSTSTFMAMRGRGDERYIGLPIFPSRSFRHGFIWVNARSDITRPEQLAGKRIGVTEYQQTASVWLRGILQDEYGVRTEDVQWVTGGMESFEPERYHVDLPERFKLEVVPPDQGLDALLARGEIDALIGAREPPSFLRREPHVRQLIPDYRRAEREYFQKTGFFPIMHMVVLRRSVYEANPWTAPSIYLAFQQVKDAGIARLWDTGSNACALPWLLADMAEVYELFGGDAFPYGISRNRKMLEYMSQMSYDQGLSPRKLGLEEIFVRELMDP
jgi:4,5-dihydroxyphthalate decarboxylase